MNRHKRYPPEVRERAVRLVLDALEQAFLVNGEIWLLVIYDKRVRENIPAHILKAIREVLENE